MPFCTNCGSAVEGQFCTNCGAKVGAETGAGAQPPVTPPPPAAPQAAPPAPAAKKTSPLVWVLVGCLGLLVIGGIIAFMGGFFIFQKAKQAGLDPELMEKNPGVAITKFLAAINPDIEVVSVDEGAGKVTLREKKTGKTVTVNFEDVKKGRISFEGEGGQKVEITGEGERGSFEVKGPEGTFRLGAGSKLPDWLPAYPGAKEEGGFNSQQGDKNVGSAVLTTGDSVEQVAGFYEDKLKAAGIQAKRFSFQGEGATAISITGEDAAGGRKASVTVGRQENQTSVNITFEAKR